MKYEHCIWKEEMTTGNSELDEHHKTLINAGNELFDYVDEGCKDPEKLFYLLSSFGSYAGFHFDEEEKFLREKQSPNLLEHAEEHNVYRKQIQDFINQSREQQLKCESLKDCEDLGHSAAEFVHDWLHNHMLTHTSVDREHISSLK